MSFNIDYLDSRVFENEVNFEGFIFLSRDSEDCISVKLYHLKKRPKKRLRFMI